MKMSKNSKGSLKISLNMTKAENIKLNPFFGISKGIR